MTCQPAREGMVGREGETLRREWGSSACQGRSGTAGRPADRTHARRAADMMRPSPSPGSRDDTLTPPLVQW